MTDRWSQHRATGTLSIVVGVFLAASSASAQVATGKFLYTEPDPEAGGGIRGAVASSAGPLEAVFAIPAADPLKVYRAEIRRGGESTFSFRGLPPARYDLLVCFQRTLFEGMTLSRTPSSLTPEDTGKIGEIISLSEPFFNRKIIHRVEGTTGHMTGTARAICTFLRTRKSIGYLDGVWRKEHRRAYKLVLLEDVGPGWQVARTREIYTVMMAPGTGESEVRYSAGLSRIRVIDSVKDLGLLTLDIGP